MDLDFLARLSSLIPPPKFPLIRFHGVLLQHLGRSRAALEVEATCRAQTACRRGHLHVGRPIDELGGGARQPPHSSCAADRGHVRNRRRRRGPSPARSLKDLLARNVPPCQVDTLQWEYDGAPVTYRVPFALLAKIVHGGRFLAIIEDEDGNGRRSALYVLNADGSLRLRIDDAQSLRGRPEQGTFGWFEPASMPAEGIFGVVFELRRDGSQVRLDIAATDGRVLAVNEYR